MSRAWMPIYWGDYFADTRHLTTLQHGAYLLLIGHYWQHDGLPTDHASLKRIAGLHGVDGENQWRSICLAIAPFFDENWKHKRIEAELEKYRELKEKRAFAGRKGGQISRGKNNNGRFVIQAIAKQTGGQLQSPIDTSSVNLEAEDAERPKIANGTSQVSSSLERVLQAKGWARG